MDRTSEVVTGGQQKSRRGKVEALGEGEVPGMQSTENPGQQREKETGVFEKGRERNFLSLVHMSTLQLGKHPLLDVCHVHMGGAHCQPPVQRSHL